MKENYQKRIHDGVVDFLRTLPKETVVDFRLFRLQDTKDTSRFS